MEDPVGLALMDRYYQFFLEVAQRALAAAGGMIDVLWIGDDNLDVPVQNVCAVYGAAKGLRLTTLSPSADVF